MTGAMKKELIKEDRRMSIAVRTILFTTIIILLSIIYLVFRWNRYQGRAEIDAIAMAQTLKVFIPEEYIKELSGTEEDLQKLEYQSIVNDLMNLVEITKPIHGAYLLQQKGDDLILLASELLNSPPGQIYEEADDVYHEPFRSGKTVLTDLTTDRWGTWISVLVPIKDPATGTVIAVFGIDYSASEWYSEIWRHMRHDIIIIICIIILSFALLYGGTQYTTNKSLSQKLSYSEALYRNVFEQAPVGIAIVNGKEFTYQSEYGHSNVNPMFEQILGRTRQELMNIKWTDITHPDDLQANLEKYEDFKKEKNKGYSMEKRYVKPDGAVVWTYIKVTPLLGLGKNEDIHLTVVEDITERKQSELALKESERKRAVLLSHLPGMAYRCCYDAEWTMLFVSEGSYHLTGYTPENLLYNRDLSFNDLISPEYRELLWKEWERTLPKKLPFKYEYEIMTKNGERKWVIEMGQGVYNDDGEVEALEGIVLDISDRKEMENNLRYINEHDEWTGLYNRDYLERLIENDAKISNSQKRAVIGINLSTIHLLTANYGFHYTQNLMKIAADTLSKYCNETRMLFKTYEYRFLFYIKNYKDPSELVAFCDSISETLEEIFVTDRIGGGIGILEIDQDDELDADLLLKRLLIASEKATNIFQKDFSYRFYNKELEDLVTREGDIRQELARIASGEDDGELYLQYQPILDLKTDTICSFEALARIRTEKLGQVPPGEFIPIAEKTKLIIPIGEKVIIKALSFLNRLKELGFKTINISINISAVQLLRPEFTTRLLEMIHEMHADPKSIVLEITESIFSSDYEEINHIISKLRDAGLHIAIDDFGTGYSSLAREKELKVNCLKIDQYFINKLLESDFETVITGDIISMAHRLGHCVIAEGVEHEEQKQYLLTHGCDKIQGYLISKPLDEERAIELLKNQESFDA